MSELNNNKNQSNTPETANGLFIHNRQLSLIVAGAIFLSFFVFMGGYFWGQKNVVESFANKIGQDSFSDQIYSSVCSLCDNGNIEDTEGEEDAGGETEVETEGDIQTLQATLDNAQQSNQMIEQSNAVSDEHKTIADNATDENEAGQTQYYAQLVGFGTDHAAQQFVEKMSRKDITVVVKKRASRSARGKFVSWYQVMTEKYDDKNELLTLVERLKNEEKLKDITIIAC